jgi:hypothetical protein
LAGTERYTAILSVRLGVAQHRLAGVPLLVQAMEPLGSDGV